MYELTVLSDMPKKYIKTVESMFSAFLWGYSNAKIALKLLQTSKKIGGLGLINLKQKETSLKISWIQILEQETSYAELVYSQIHEMGKNIFRCNLKEEDVLDLGIKIGFWRDVVRAWSRFNYNRENMI